MDSAARYKHRSDQFVMIRDLSVLSKKPLGWQINTNNFNRTSMNDFASAMFHEYRTESRIANARTIRTLASLVRSFLSSNTKRSSRGYPIQVHLISHTVKYLGGSQRSREQHVYLSVIHTERKYARKKKFFCWRSKKISCYVDSREKIPCYGSLLNIWFH